MDKEFFTITEAMPIFGVSRTTVTYWITEEIINAEKIKGKWMIDGHSVKNWQEFQASGFPAGNKVIRKKFELAFRKNKTTI
ncbi:helix-turn-helix domain-containing protein [Planomicrobium sp. CPCC 101110]|uniref:helix-turn-helix domain-containing protein n=1 Tax=Planomicrobium sp. CPCC 101110 TaxID=2599619 RepID=UPI0011B8063C|nr:helix-turn-helix domain-containing protein [Planomicrobium sp. CPCC 101110]TWT25819.1 helix-turn-helix domain-containing protein [Planomicrobium sp. CPCC 101110]